MKTTFVQTHTVTDPDSKLPVEIEIRKLESGGIVGLDASWLASDEGPVFSPYDKAVQLGIPDDESAISDDQWMYFPHYVLHNSGDGVYVSLTHWSDGFQANVFVERLLADYVDDLHGDDDDGVAWSVKIEEALQRGDLDLALGLFHSVPDQLASIEVGIVTFSMAENKSLESDE